MGFGSYLPTEGDAILARLTSGPHGVLVAACQTTKKLNRSLNNCSSCFECRYLLHVYRCSESVFNWLEKHLSLVK